MESNFTGPEGWHYDPAEVERIIMLQPAHARAFKTAAPQIFGTDWKDTWLWVWEDALFGKTLPAFLQTRGTCVSQAIARAIQDQIGLNIVMRVKPEEWKAGVATEPIYGGSRIEVGRGQLGRGEGSVGAWGWEWVKKWGVLFRLNYGPGLDLTMPNDEVAVKWGTQSSGVPTELETIARERPVDIITPISNVEELAVSITNSYGAAVGSQQGFTGRRDTNGFDRPSGTWSHEMYFRGVLNVKGNRHAIAVQQSWGNQPVGPDIVTLETGEQVKLPQGVFLIDFSVADSMIKRGRDCFTGAGVRGFERKDVMKIRDWGGLL